MNSENLTDECVDDEELFKSNPWSYHECNPAPCNLEIAFIDGAVLLMCYTPKHNVKVLQGQTHRRFFTKAAYPYTWIRPVSSRHLMSSIRLEKYKAEPPPRTGLKLAERGAGDDEIILAVCSEGSLYMYEARTCEVLGLVVLARRHELFVSGKGADQAKVEHNKIHEKQKGDHSGASDGGGDGKKEGKKPKKQNKDEKVLLFLRPDMFYFPSILFLFDGHVRASLPHFSNAVVYPPSFLSFSFHRARKILWLPTEKLGKWKPRGLLMHFA